jgi:adenylate kinase family enzyme
MEEYAEKTKPLKAFYQERKLVTEIDGVGQPDAILKATKAALAGGPRAA